MLGPGDKLFNDLQVDLLHVNLLAKFGREFGRLHESSISRGCHCGLRRDSKKCYSTRV